MIVLLASLLAVLVPSPARAQSAAVNFAVTTQTVAKTDLSATITVTRGSSVGALQVGWSSAPGTASGTSISLPSGGASYYGCPIVMACVPARRLSDV